MHSLLPREPQVVPVEERRLVESGEGRKALAAFFFAGWQLKKSRPPVSRSKVSIDVFVFCHRQILAPIIFL